MSTRLSIPLNSIEPGTTLFVEGASSVRTRTVALLLLLAAKRSDLGLLIISADTPGEEMVSWCRRARQDLELSNVKIIDCTGEGADEPDGEFGPDIQHLPAAGEQDVDFGIDFDGFQTPDEEASDADETEAAIERLPSASDLSSLGIKFSILHENLSNYGYDPVLTGLMSVSTVLENVDDVRTVFRFLMLVSGRVKSADGLGVFPIDSSAHDEVTVNTVREAFDGGIEIRETDGNLEFRAHNLPDQPEGWTPFTVSK